MSKKLYDTIGVLALLALAVGVAVLISRMLPDMDTSRDQAWYCARTCVEHGGDVHECRFNCLVFYKP